MPRLPSMDSEMVRILVKSASVHNTALYMLVISEQPKTCFNFPHDRKKEGMSTIYTLEK